MTIENGLDTPDTELLDKMLTEGRLEPRVAAYVSAVRSQSIGWMIHDKVVCNLLRVSQAILRTIKRAVAKLPGVRRVRYVNHRGQPYDGLLIGDHAEGEGYKIAGWYDGDRLVPGEPPMIVPPPALDIPPLHPTSTSSLKPRRRKREKPSPSASLDHDGPSGPEDVRVERVTPGNSAKRVTLAEMSRAHPEVAPGCAVLDAVLDHKDVRLKPSHWQGSIESYTGAFTPAEAYQAVEHVAGRGQPFTPETVADAINLTRRARRVPASATPSGGDL